MGGGYYHLRFVILDGNPPYIMWNILFLMKPGQQVYKTRMKSSLF